MAVQPMFMDPNQPSCKGKEGDAKCNIVIKPDLLKQGWEEHFGYLKARGYGMVVGELGGNMEWPGGQASIRDRNRYSAFTDPTVACLRFDLVHQGPWARRALPQAGAGGGAVLHGQRYVRDAWPMVARQHIDRVALALLVLFGRSSILCLASTLMS